MRKTFSLLFLIFLFTSTCPWVSQAQPKCICLTWAFIVSGDGGPDRILDVTKQPVIHSGDKFRFVMDFETSPDRVYLLRLDSHGELTVLCPPLQAQGKKMEFPRKGEWYTVDQATGMETFYFLATYYPLDLLARAVQLYIAEPKSAGAKATVLDEFENARRSYTEPYAKERGVQIAGATGEATSVNAGAFYAIIAQFRHE